MLLAISLTESIQNLLSERSHTFRIKNSQVVANKAPAIQHRIDGKVFIAMSGTNIHGLSTSSMANYVLYHGTMP